MDETRTLAGRIGIVTGASSGIGRAVASALLESGAHVVINARRKERLDQLANALPIDRGRVAVVAGDITKEQTIDSLFTAAQRTFDALPNLVVVNAGRGLLGSLLNSTPEQWEEMITLNVHGALSLMRQAALCMLEQVERIGRYQRPFDIVVLGSCVGRHVVPRASVYSSTKFAVHAAAEALRREIGPKGIRVTLIEPGIVRTSFHDVAGFTPGFYDQWEETNGPLIHAEDIARGIVYSVSQPAHVHVQNMAIRAVAQDYP